MPTKNHISIIHESHTVIMLPQWLFTPAVVYPQNI